MLDYTNVKILIKMQLHVWGENEQIKGKQLINNMYANKVLLSREAGNEAF